jgi:uncharacterized membrane protein HdeD (DUF308 family)
MASGKDARDVVKRRLNALAWGVLLAWTGAILLAPGDLETLWHVWLLGVGVILLGLGSVAVSLGRRPDTETWIFGAVGLVAGAAGLAGIAVSAVGLALLLFGLEFIVAVGRASLASS